MGSDTITMTKIEFERAKESAVQAERLAQLAQNVEAMEVKQQQYLKDIFDKLRDVQKDINTWPQRLNDCSHDLEKDLLRQISNKYMTQEAGQLMERKLLNSISSIKLWIVSTVGGFTAAGVFILWYFKLLGD